MLRYRIKVDICVLDEKGPAPREFTYTFECDGFQMKESHHWARPKKGEMKQVPFVHPPMCKNIVTIRMDGNVTRRRGLIHEAVAVKPKRARKAKK